MTSLITRLINAQANKEQHDPELRNELLNLISMKRAFEAAFISKFPTDEQQEWLEENGLTKADYDIRDRNIYFHNPDHAVHWRLRWAGE